MTLEFHKYQGTGNDFILIDNRQLSFPKDNPKLISHLCDRRFGIGSDGLILIEEHEYHDFEMVFYNPDESQSFCGNGSRCAVAFAHNLQVIHKTVTFLAIDGPHEAVIENELVKVRMGDVSKTEVHEKGNFIHTGSPHLMIETPDLQTADVYHSGQKLRYSKPYATEGININFIEYLEDSVFARTYERGVENETLSCGTGVTAVALNAALKGFKSPVTVKTRGGTLIVEFTQTSNGGFSDIYLTGPAELVFQGRIEI